jgi:hypothetical protein
LVNNENRALLPVNVEKCIQRLFKLKKGLHNAK